FFAAALLHCASFASLACAGSAVEMLVQSLPEMSMPLDIAIQMDHVSTIHIKGDTTFALALEAQARGHRLFHYTPQRLSMRDGRVSAAVEALTVQDVEGDHFR